MLELLKNVIGGAIRHVAGAAAAIVTANGLTPDGSTEETVAGAFGLVLVIAWSAVNKWVLNKKEPTI